MRVYERHPASCPPKDLVYVGPQYRRGSVLLVQDTTRKGKDKWELAIHLLRRRARHGRPARASSWVRTYHHTRAAALSVAGLQIHDMERYGR